MNDYEERTVVNLYRKLDKYRDRCIKIKSDIFCLSNNRCNSKTQPADERTEIYMDLKRIERQIPFLDREICSLTFDELQIKEHLFFKLDRLIEKHENNKQLAYRNLNIFIPRSY